MNLGRYGIWLNKNRLTPEVAAQVEDLGFGALWLGGSPGGRLDDVARALGATRSITVATGIVNVWKDDAATIAQSWADIETRFPGRFLLGIGIGHPEATSEYRKPYETLFHYLDVLDQYEVPVTRRVLAALGPRVLQLAADRTAGAHPYLVPAAHSARAREVLGVDELLAPEHKVVLREDPEEARAVARPTVRPYLGLSNYAANLRRLGYADSDLAGDGSDRLIDDLVAHGSPEQVRDRLHQHLAAGADHVAVQPLIEDDSELAPALRTLAGVLI